MKYSELNTAQRRMICVVLADKNPFSEQAAQVLRSLSAAGYKLQHPIAGWINVYSAYLLEVERIVKNCGVVDAKIFVDPNFISDSRKLENAEF